MILSELITAVQHEVSYAYDTADEHIRRYANWRCAELIRKCPNLWFMQVEDTMPTIRGIATCALPDDYSSAMQLYLIDPDDSSYRLLRQCSKGDMLRHASGHEMTTNSGEPTAWALWKTTIELDPVPDAVYTLRMVYWANAVALEGSGSTNLVLTNAPQAITAGVVADMALADSNITLHQFWTQRWNELLVDLRKENFTRVTAGSAMIEKKLNKYGKGAIRERGR